MAADIAKKNKLETQFKKIEIDHTDIEILLC